MNINKILIASLSLVAVSTLSGCAKSPKTLNLNYITANSAPSPTTDQASQEQLSQAAVSVSHSLNELSAIQKATHPHAKFPKPMNPKSINMNQLASLDWTGPIEPLLKKVAHITHYKLTTLGKAPAIPVVVSIQAKNVPIATILRNASFQAQNKADVTVYPATHTLELRYY